MFSHFSGTYFWLIFHVLSCQVLNEKTHPRASISRASGCIFLINLLKLRKVKPTIPYERCYENHTFEARLFFVLIRFCNDVLQTSFLLIYFAFFHIFAHFEVAISSKISTKSCKILQRLFKALQSQKGRS